MVDSFNKIFLSVDQECGLYDGSFPLQVDTKEYESLFQENEESRTPIIRNHYALSDIEKLRTLVQKINLPNELHFHCKAFSDGQLMKSIRNKLDVERQSVVTHQSNWEEEVLELMGDNTNSTMELSSNIQKHYDSFIRPKSLPEDLVPFSCFDADCIDTSESHDPLSDLFPNSTENNVNEDNSKFIQPGDRATGRQENEITANNTPSNPQTTTYNQKKKELRRDLFARFSRGQDDMNEVIVGVPDAVSGTLPVLHGTDEKVQRFEKEKMKKLQKIERIKNINTFVDATQSLIKGPISHHAKRLRETASFLNRIRVLIQHLQHSRIAMTHKNTKPDLYEMEYKYFHRPHMLLKERQRNWKVSLKHSSNVNQGHAFGTTTTTKETNSSTAATTTLINNLPFGNDGNIGQGGSNANTTTATYYMLMEYIEEFPSVMLNYGMVSTILNYYRSGTTTTTDDDTATVSSSTSLTLPGTKGGNMNVATAMSNTGKGPIDVSGSEIRKYPRIEANSTSIRSATNSKATLPQNQSNASVVSTLSNPQFASYLSYLPKHVYSLYELSQYYFDASNHNTFVSPLNHQAMLGYGGKSSSTSLPPVGQTKILSPDDHSPFLFNFREQDTVTSFENTLFRCPIFRHDVPNTDFLLIKIKSIGANHSASQQQAKLGLTNEHGTHIYHLKEIQYMYLAGQIEPQRIVPIPTSTIQNSFAFSKIQEKFIIVTVLRLLQQHSGGLTMDEICKYILKYHLNKDHAHGHSGTGPANTSYNYYLQQKSKMYKYYIEQLVSRYAESDGGTGYDNYGNPAKARWRLKEEHEFAAEQELRSFSPEDVCLLESSLAYEYKLQHVHHIYFTGYANNGASWTGNSTPGAVVPANQQNVSQGSMELLLKIQYYLLLTYSKKKYYLDVVYTNLLQQLRKQQLVSLKGKNVVLHKTTRQPTLKMRQYGEPEAPIGPDGQIPLYYQHPLLYYFHKKIQHLNATLEIIRYILHHVLIAPWNTTFTFVKSHVEKDTSKYGIVAPAGMITATSGPGSASNFMQLNDFRGDPSGISEGYSYIRLPYNSFTQLQSLLFPLQAAAPTTAMTTAQKKEENKIVGSTRDLRKLHKSDAINLLVALGVKKDEATKLKRWDRIHVIREMVNDLEKKGLITADLRKYVRDPVLVQRVMADKKQNQGEGGMGNSFMSAKPVEWEKEVFGAMTQSAITSEEEYQLCCQEIWVRQRASLSMTTKPSLAPSKGQSARHASINDDDSMETDLITGEIDAEKDIEGRIAPGKDGSIPIREEEDDDSDDDFEEIERKLAAKKAANMMGSTMTSHVGFHFKNSSNASIGSSSTKEREAFERLDKEELNNFLGSSAFSTNASAPVPTTSKSISKMKFTFGTADKANANVLLSDASSSAMTPAKTIGSSSSGNNTAIHSSSSTNAMMSSTANATVTPTTSTTPSMASSMMPWDRPGKAVRRLTIITQPDGSEVTKVEYFWQRDEIDRVETIQGKQRKERRDMRMMLPTSANRMAFSMSGGPGMAGTGRGRGGRGRRPNHARFLEGENGVGGGMGLLEDDEDDTPYGGDGSGAPMTVRLAKLKQVAQHHHHATATNAMSNHQDGNNSLSIRKLASSHGLVDDEEELYMQKSYKSTKRSAATLVNLRLPRVSLAIRFEKELMTLWHSKNAEAFRHPVDGKTYPAYYTIVANPICLSDIRQKILSYQYTTVQSFLEDLDLMVSNCRQFNGKMSPLTSLGEKLVEACKVNLQHDRKYLGQEHDTLTKLEDTIVQKELFYSKTRLMFGRTTGQPLSLITHAAQATPTVAMHAQAAPKSHGYKQ